MHACNARTSKRSKAKSLGRQVKISLSRKSSCSYLYIRDFELLYKLKTCANAKAKKSWQKRAGLELEWNGRIPIEYYPVENLPFLVEEAYSVQPNEDANIITKN